FAVVELHDWVAAAQGPVGEAGVEFLVEVAAAVGDAGDGAEHGHVALEGAAVRSARAHFEVEAAGDGFGDAAVLAFVDVALLVGERDAVLLPGGHDAGLDALQLLRAVLGGVAGLVDVRPRRAAVLFGVERVALLPVGLVAGVGVAHVAVG